MITVCGRNGNPPDAEDHVLAWCRRSNGIVMRSGDGRCNLWDNSLIEPEMVFSGESWQQVWDEYCSTHMVEIVPRAVCPNMLSLAIADGSWRKPRHTRWRRR